MEKEALKHALISILIGAAVLALNSILQGLLTLLTQYWHTLVPAAVSAIHYLSPWQTNQTA